MDKKKLNNAVMILPVVVAVLVVAVILVFLLGSGNNTPNAPVTQLAAVETDTGEDVAQDIPANSGPSCEFGFLVGLRSAEAVEKIEPLDRPYRVIAPNTAVTQDYRIDRINLMTDDNDIVESVDCN